MITADLTGKKALVTGGASGIGLGTVKLFAEMGATVAVNDVPGNPKLDTVIADLSAAGLSVIAAPGDLSDAASTREMVVSAAERMGGLDYLVAGVSPEASMQDGLICMPLPRLLAYFGSTRASAGTLPPPH